MQAVQSTHPHGHGKHIYRSLFVAIVAVSTLGLLPANQALAAKREFNMTIEEVRIQEIGRAHV